ncbi:MAG: tRNA lysidine(34) synthetase TilS [Bacilli bacterium]|nr:tRNA lysidine(34) synthetase TilS [Bacilli bacterium]
MDLVYDFLINQVKLNKNDKIVVGVSAGPDSMFLLWILMELRNKIGFSLIVSHINHNVRIESMEEEVFLKEYCLKNKVEFSSMKIEEYSKENFHEYARNIRYNFYETLIKKYKANYLMTAHHGDDLIETILMRLTRGSTIHGYTGIELIRNMDNYKIVRPLLYMTKKEIKEFNDKNNIPYRIDKSNESSKYTRNRYRMNILPFLKEEDKDVHLKFLKFSKMLEDATNYLDKVVDKVVDKVYENRKINLDLFNKEDDFIKRLVLEKIMKDLYNKLSKIEEKHIDILLNLIKKNKNGNSINLPDNIIAIINYGYLEFIEELESKEYKLELIDGLVIPNGFKFIKLDKEENGNDTLHLESHMVKLPLYVRNKKEGDFIELKGTNGKRRVSDVFIDSKISKVERESYPVVVDSEDKIIWIPKLKKSKYDSKNHEKCDIIIKCL